MKIIVKQFFYVLIFLVLISCGSDSGNRLSNAREEYGTENHSHDDLEEDDGEKPSAKKIQYDLVGHKLSEGLSEGYRRSDWAWEINDGEISDFAISEVLSDNESEYEIVATMILSSTNHKYDAKVQLCYVQQGGQWQLIKVKSLGLKAISDKRFEDCLSYKIGDDGWGGVTCLQVTNESETPLVVGGRILTEYNGWKNFSIKVDAFKTENVGGTLYGGSVSDYDIHFVIRP